MESKMENRSARPESQPGNSRKAPVMPDQQFPTLRRAAATLSAPPQTRRPTPLGPTCNRFEPISTA
jgi:hypothetical protein